MYSPLIVCFVLLVTMFGPLYRNNMDEDEDDEKENLLEGNKPTIKSSKRNYQVLRLLFVTGVALNTIFGILGLLTFASFVQSGKPSYENGFDTDLGRQISILIPFIILLY